MNGLLDLSGTYQVSDEMKSVHLFPGSGEGRWGMKAEGTGSLWNLPGATELITGKPGWKQSGSQHGQSWEDRDMRACPGMAKVRREGTACGQESEQSMYMYPHIPPNTLPHPKHTGQSEELTAFSRLPLLQSLGPGGVPWSPIAGEEYQ